MTAQTIKNIFFLTMIIAWGCLLVSYAITEPLFVNIFSQDLNDIFVYYYFHELLLKAALFFITTNILIAIFSMNTFSWMPLSATLNAVLSAVTIIYLFEIDSLR